MRSTFAWGMAHGAWCITVRVSEPALAHHGAMPHAIKFYTVLSMSVKINLPKFSKNSPIR